MNGKWLVGGMLVFAAVFGVGLWYSTNFAYYEENTDVSEITAFGGKIAVSDYRSIDADTSPLKMRACFTVDFSTVAYADYLADGEPLIGPAWFDCFNAEQISNDIAAGNAVVLRATDNEPYGFTQYIAYYADGRAYMWRQINACGDAKFSGDELPEGCEIPSVDALAVPKPPEVVAAVTLPNPSVPSLADLTGAIRLLPLIGDGPEEIETGPVQLRGNSDFPLSLHGCFDMPQSFGLLTETFVTAEPSLPRQVPGGLTCFDAEQLAEDLQIGYAIAFWSEQNINPGVDRVVAVYDDGRAFVWHQKNQTYAE